MGPDVRANSLDLDDSLTHWSTDIEFYIGCFLCHCLLPCTRNAGPIWRLSGRGFCCSSRHRLRCAGRPLFPFFFPPHRRCIGIFRFIDSNTRARQGGKSACCQKVATRFATLAALSYYALFFLIMNVEHPTAQQRSGVRRHAIMETPMGRGLSLWLIGIPIPIILLIWMFGGLHG
jgi:hypothetical protein